MESKKKLLLGGSPCTHWSIAQRNNRETQPEGIGWELFLNYVIAIEKYQPDYFLYENNKSMSKAIEKEITKYLGFGPICINSKKVCPQNRNRFYWVGKRNPDGTYSKVEVLQPNDKHIYIEDVIDISMCRPTQNLLVDLHMVNPPLQFHSDGMYQLGYVGNTNSQSNRVYDIKGKSPCLQANGGGAGAKTGLYWYYGKIVALNSLGAEVLQTLPKGYTSMVSSNKALKLIGNGWTVDVISHILSHIPEITTALIEVLSMYDGISCGHVALDRLGANITKYYATEIDTTAISVTQANYPNTIQLGDAFQVREDTWCIL